MTYEFKQFIETGKRPGTQKQTSALLDTARNVLLSQPNKNMQLFTNKSTAKKGETLLDQLTAEHRVKNGMPPAPPTAKPVATAPARRNPAARPAPAAVIHRASTTAAKPATTSPSAPLATITAAQFAKPQLRMAKSEFDGMSPADKSRFCTSGGKLV